MKFKMQNKQNQLIERISIKHLVIGVDIDKKDALVIADMVKNSYYSEVRHIGIIQKA